MTKNLQSTQRSHTLSQEQSLSPDLDLDVGVSKVFSIESDPALPFGPAPNPRLVLPLPALRLTVYTSDGDKALGLSEWLIGSLRRLGRVDQALLSKEQIEKSRAIAAFAAFVQVTQTAGFIGHVISCPTRR